MWSEDFSPALLTDPYELTMAYGYWKLGMHKQRAMFHHFYRTAPFDIPFVVSCGIWSLVGALEIFHYSKSDLDYLSEQRGVDGKPLFEEKFLIFLEGLKISCNIDAVEEGVLVYPHEPLVRVEGPILEAQLLETLLLNLINFQSLVATKAACIRLAAGDDEVMEFGLRRAHGPNGGLLASRAAYIGGCDSVSNVQAGKTFGIPIKGTMAHSWVMAFDSEKEAFEKWAEVMPGNCVLLIDTYNTPTAIEKAIQIPNLYGVRLDSGDLLSLSKYCRKRLDEAGLSHVKIVASNNLDEKVIAELKRQGSPIEVWGVGTRLVTGHPKGALGGVYKLSAVQKGGEWLLKAKTTDEPHKASPASILQVKPSPSLVPIFREGKLVYEFPSIEKSRETTMRQLHESAPSR